MLTSNYTWRKGIIVSLLTLLFFCPVDDTFGALSTSTSDMILTPGVTQDFTISGGTGFYKITSSDTAVATVSVSGSTGDQGSIQGLSIGTSTITIEDSNGDTATITVTVSQLTLSKSAVALVPNGTETVTILTGSTYYNVSSSDDAVATASVYNDTVTITGVAVGTAVITITDNNNDAALVDVTVGYGFTVSPASLTLSIGETGTATISDDTGFYNALSSDDTVAEVTLSGTVLSVKGITAGTAIITVSSSTGYTATLPVTVDASVYGTVVLGISTSANYSLTGGSGFYNVDIADNIIVSASVLGDDLTLTGKAAGTTTVTVVDNQANKVVITVFVKLPAPVLDWSSDDTLVTLSWDAVAGGNSYILYYAPADTAGAVDTLQINKINLGGLNALVFHLSSGDHYYLALQAVHGTHVAMSSLASNIVEIQIP